MKACIEVEIKTEDFLQYFKKLSIRINKIKKNKKFLNIKSINKNFDEKLESCIKFK